MKKKCVFGIILCGIMVFMTACNSAEDSAVKSQEITEKTVITPENDKNIPQNLTHDGGVLLNSKNYSVTVADTPTETAKGLMFVENMPANHGMLFVFEQEGVYPFYMKNTLIPLDMIWIKKDGTITDFTTMQPCQTQNCPAYSPKGEAKYVLELNAGEFEGDVGDKVEINL